MTDLNQAHHLEIFKKLVKMRARMIWPLSIFLLLALAGNLYLMSSGASLGAKKISPDGAVTIALAYSVLLIFTGASIAGFYVWWANKKLDPLTEEVRREISALKGKE